MVKKADRPEEGPTCPRCQTTNRPARSFCRRCGAYLKATLPTGRAAPIAPAKARRPPNPVSARRLAEKETREEVVAFVLARDGRRCQAGPIHALTRLPCGGRLDPHERIPRSAWAQGYLVAANVIIVCEHAHRWIDHHPEGAHALGFHGFSWERPDEFVVGVSGAVAAE